MNSTLLRRLRSIVGAPEFVNTVEWFVYHVTGVALVIAVTVAVAAASVDTDLSLLGFTSAGQGALFSLSLLSTTNYLLNKNSSLRLNFTSPLGIFHYLLSGAAITFLVLSLLRSNGAKLALDVLTVPTLLLLFMSTLVAFVAVWMDQRRLGMTSADLANGRQQRLEDLAQRFRGAE